jgi:hypothetical protein
LRSSANVAKWFRAIFRKFEWTVVAGLAAILLWPISSVTTTDDLDKKAPKSVKISPKVEPY